MRSSGSPVADPVAEAESTLTTIERGALTARVFEVEGERFSYEVRSAVEPIGFGSCDTYEEALAAAMRAIGEDDAVEP
jgi:hypothetical protein